MRIEVLMRHLMICCHCFEEHGIECLIIIATQRYDDIHRVSDYEQANAKANEAGVAINERSQLIRANQNAAKVRISMFFYFI